MTPDLQEELEHVARVQAQPVHPKLSVIPEREAVNRSGHVEPMQ